MSRGKGWEELALLARKVAKPGHDRASKTCLFSLKSIANSEASLMGCFSLLHQMINHEGYKKESFNYADYVQSADGCVSLQSLSQTTAAKSMRGQKRFQKFKTQHESNLPLFNNHVNYPTHVHDITYNRQEKCLSRMKLQVSLKLICPSRPIAFARLMSARHIAAVITLEGESAVPNLTSVKRKGKLCRLVTSENDEFAMHSFWPLLIIDASLIVIGVEAVN